MAKEYIERDVLLDDLRESYQELKEIYNGLTYDVDKTVCRAELDAFVECILRVKGFPAADVVEVKHGEWIASHEEFCECSLCKYPVYAAWNKTNFCPNCGAKMDGERREK